jgi:hypothetical protein
MIEAHGARSPVALGPFAKQGVEVPGRRLFRLFIQEELDLVDEPAANPRIASIETLSVGFPQKNLFVDELGDDALPLFARERAQQELFPLLRESLGEVPGYDDAVGVGGRPESVREEQETSCAHELQQGFPEEASNPAAVCHAPW